MTPSERGGEEGSLRHEPIVAARIALDDGAGVGDALDHGRGACRRRAA